MINICVCQKNRSHISIFPWKRRATQPTQHINPAALLRSTGNGTSLSHVQIWFWFSWRQNDLEIWIVLLYFDNIVFTFTFIKTSSCTKWLKLKLIRVFQWQLFMFEIEMPKTFFNLVVTEIFSSETIFLESIDFSFQFHWKFCENLNLDLLSSDAIPQ